MATKKAAKKMISAKSRAARIRRDNKAFDAMSPNQKRVRIAQEVIAQLAIGRIRPRQGVWVSFPDDDAKDFYGNPNDHDNSEAPLVMSPDAELSDLFKGKECNACGIGAMLVCALDLGDNFPARRLSDDGLNDLDSYKNASKENPVPVAIDAEDAFKYLGRFFPKKQLELIEAAFEDGQGAIHDNEAAGYFDPFAGDEEMLDSALRMTLIMQNIIVNDGRFNPKLKPTLAIPGFREIKGTS